MANTTLIASIIVAVLAVLVGGIYFSGQADEIQEWVAKKYFRAAAEAEKTALAAAGSEKAEGFLKEKLKGNPVVGDDELEDVGSKLGKAFD